jgi:hypothetical protein
MWVPGTRFPRLRTEYWSPGELPTPPWTPMPYKRQTAPAVSHHGTQKPAPTVRDDVAPYVVKSLENDFRPVTAQVTAPPIEASTLDASFG